MNSYINHGAFILYALTWKNVPDILPEQKQVSMLYTWDCFTNFFKMD